MLGLSGSVVGLEWHDKIDQILVGHGGRKEGVLTVLYNPRMSSKGALLAMAVKVRGWVWVGVLGWGWVAVWVWGWGCGCLWSLVMQGRCVASHDLTCASISICNCLI